MKRDDNVTKSVNVALWNAEGSVELWIHFSSFYLQYISPCMSSLMQATSLFFSSVDIRRERRTRGMSSALRYQRYQPIIVSATLELDGETSLYTEYRS